jgi:hypothetical protein
VPGDGNIDYYLFQSSGGTVILDIDFGTKSTGSIDTELFLFSSNGTLVAQNDESTRIDLGSNSVSDAYIRTTVAAGTYIVGVGQSGSFFEDGRVLGNAPNSGQTYTLNISVEGQQPF